MAALGQGARSNKTLTVALPGWKRCSSFQHTRVLAPRLLRQEETALLLQAEKTFTALVKSWLFCGQDRTWVGAVELSK